LALLDVEERVRPGDWDVHGLRGSVLAGLGRHADALHEADWLAQSDWYRKDRFGDVSWYGVILMRAGETDAALAEIERLLAGPSRTTVHLLRLDPRWDPIRDNPRFQALLTKYADPAIPR